MVDDEAESEAKKRRDNKAESAIPGEFAEDAAADEMRAPKTLSTPVEPTPQEREEHNLAGHAFFRSWCRHCVRGKGKSLAHKQLDADKAHTVPHISFDYVFLGQEDEEAFPIVLICDHPTRITYSHAVPCKSTAGSPYLAKQMAHKVTAR